MKKQIIIVLFLITIALQKQETDKSKGLMKEVESLCKWLEDVRQEYSTQTQGLIRAMNSQINAKHIDYRDADKPKAQEVIRLNKKVEEVTKKAQFIFNNRFYTRYCNLLLEELQYGNIPDQQLEKGIEELTLLKIQIISRKEEEQKQEEL